MIGSTVGRYRILAKLGEGGMGSVWKAEDTLLGRTIALKFLPQAQASSPDARRRFLREAQAASVLDHPGVATVFDAGEADGRVYIALLHVDGETVAERVTRGPLPVAEAVRIARAAAEALHHAHERGILHRDVSARNIMVARDGRVVVVDFGLALPEGQTRITHSGATLGTVAYMAPEVIRGKEADRRSDLYALGVVLYEMLTGTLPFSGERPEAVLYAAVHREPDRPSARRADLPGALDAIVLRTLAKDPERRAQSGTDLAAELAAYETGKVWHPESAETEPLDAARILAPSEAQPAPPRAASGTEIAAAPGPRWSRWIAASAAAVFLALLLWPGMLARLKKIILPGADRPRRIAVLPLRNVSEEPEQSDHIADGIGDALVTKLTQVSGLQVTPWLTSQRYVDPDRPLPEIAAELRVDALLVGTLRTWGGALHGTLGLVDAKSGMQTWGDEYEEPIEDLFVLQRRIALGVATRLKGKLSGDEQDALAQSLAENAEAYEYYLRGAHAMQGGDRESFDLAAGMFTKALELDPKLAQAHVGMGAVQTARAFNAWGGRWSDLDAAEASFREALRINPHLAAARRGLIHVHFLRGEDEKCLKEGQEVASLGSEDAENLLVRADAYHFGSLFENAVPMYQRVLDLDPANAGAQAFLCITYSQLGKSRESIQAGEVFLRKFGDDSDVHRVLGWVHECAGDFERARLHLEKAVEIVPEAPQLYWDLGAIYRKVGREQDARRTWETGLEILERTGERPDFRAALLLAMLGRASELAEEERKMLAQGPVNGFMIAHLGNAQAILGNTSGAVERWRRAMRMHHRYQIEVRCPEIMFSKSVAAAPLYAEFRREYAALGDSLSAVY